jgi:hypothetical protein
LAATRIVMRGNDLRPANRLDGFEVSIRPTIFQTNDGRVTHLLEAKLFGPLLGFATHMLSDPNNCSRCVCGQTVDYEVSVPPSPLPPLARDIRGAGRDLRASQTEVAGFQ